MASKGTESAHVEQLEWLLDKTITTLSQTDNGVAVAALVKRAADISREIEELAGSTKSTSAAQSKMDEVKARREKRQNTA